MSEPVWETRKGSIFGELDADGNGCSFVFVEYDPILGFFEPTTFFDRIPKIGLHPKSHVKYIGKFTADI